MNYLDVANSPILWLSVLPVVIIVVVQGLIFLKLAKKAAPLADLSTPEINKAFRVGATSAIGPALGVFVVMLGLMAAIGGPLAFQRLAIIGAAPTELAAATMAAKAQGLTLGGEGYGLVNFANACWVMALNGSAWLFMTGMFTDKIERINHKVSGGNKNKVGILGTAAMLGAMGFLVCTDVTKELHPKPGVDNSGYIATAIGAGIAMVILEKIAKKYPKLVEFNLGIAMIVGMICGVLFSAK